MTAGAHAESGGAPARRDSPMPENVVLINGKKFMWDGVDDPSAEKTLERLNKYKADGFEVELREEDKKSYLYTRRVVRHIVAPSG